MNIKKPRLRYVIVALLSFVFVFNMMSIGVKSLLAGPNLSESTSISPSSLEIADGIISQISKSKLTASAYYLELTKDLAKNNIIDVNSDPYSFSLRYYAKIAIQKLFSQFKMSSSKKISGEFKDKQIQLSGIYGKKHKIIVNETFPHIFDYSFSDNMVIVNKAVYKKLKSKYRKATKAYNKDPLSILFEDDQAAALIFYELLDGVPYRELARIGILLTLDCDHKWIDLLKWTKTYYINNKGTAVPMYDIMLSKVNEGTSQFICDATFKSINNSLVTNLDKKTRKEFNKLSREKKFYCFSKALNNLRHYYGTIESVADALINREPWAEYLPSPYNYLEKPQLKGRLYSVRDQTITWATSFNENMIDTVGFIKYYIFIDNPLQDIIWSESVSGIKSLNTIFTNDLQRIGKLDYSKHRDFLDTSKLRPLRARLTHIELNNTDSAILLFLNNRTHTHNSIVNYISSYRGKSICSLD